VSRPLSLWIARKFVPDYEEFAILKSFAQSNDQSSMLCCCHVAINATGTGGELPSGLALAGQLNCSRKDMFWRRANHNSTIDQNTLPSQMQMLVELVR
jgi:hypothetical protein